MINKSEFLKVIQFGLVGSIGVIVDIGGTWFFKEKCMLSPYFASCIGFSIAVFNNYVLNKYWTFREKSIISLSQFFGFLAVSLGGLLLNTLSVFVMHDGIGWSFYLSKIIAVGIVVPWNYSANSRLVFKQSRFSIMKS